MRPHLHVGHLPHERLSGIETTAQSVLDGDKQQLSVTYPFLGLNCEVQTIIVLVTDFTDFIKLQNSSVVPKDYQQADKVHFKESSGHVSLTCSCPRMNTPPGLMGCQADRSSPEPLFTPSWYASQRPSLVVHVTHTWCHLPSLRDRGRVTAWRGERRDDPVRLQATLLIHNPVSTRQILFLQLLGRGRIRTHWGGGGFTQTDSAPYSSYDCCCVSVRDGVEKANPIGCPAPFSSALSGVTP